MKKIILLLVLLQSYGFAQSTFPKNGVQDERSIRYAFTNAQIVVDAQTVLDTATLLVRDGLIEAVGKNVSIPQGAVVQNLQGKRIYPALIDLYADYGMPEVKRAAGFSWGSLSNPQYESNKKGAFGWNQAIRAEVDAAQLFTADTKKAEELRKLGFATVLSHVPDGIVRGSGVVVSLADGKENNLILKGRASAHYSLDKGSSTQQFPVSLMGCVALLRQTYYDAEWYKNGGSRKEKNLSLEAFNALQNLPQIYETTDKWGVLRAAKIADEFDTEYIVKGGGDEYQRIQEIKNTDTHLIVPLNFPVAYDVEDPFDAQFVSLAQLKHWEMAAANAAALSQAGVIFALTSADLKEKKDFWTNLRKAIEHGLPEQKALEALTSTPAQMLHIEQQVGRLKTGMLANFLITSDNLFDKNNTIHENWIQGKRYVLNDMNTPDLRGTYSLTIGEKTGMKLLVTGKVDKPEWQLVLNDSTKFSPKVSFSHPLITLSSKLDKTAGLARLSGYVADKTLKGEGNLADGKSVKWQAVLTEPYKIDTKKDTTKTKTPQIGNIIYPFAGFGNATKPTSVAMLIKNVTIWTSEVEGVIERHDVLIRDGKIAQIGINIFDTTAVQIDGTGKHLTAGIIDEHSHIGLFAINDVQTNSAEVRMEDVINADDVNFYRQLAGGTTTAQLLHGSANSIGGQSAIVKFKWGEASENLRIKGADGFIKFALGENVKQSSRPFTTERFPATRMGVEQVYIDAFTRAKEYEQAWKTFNALPEPQRKTQVPPRKDLEMDAILEILNQKRFITCHSYVQSEINMLMKVADSLGFKVNTFTHILEGYKVADKMKARNINASTFSDWWAYKMEVKEAIPYNAAIMTKVGVNTAINSDDAEMARRLNQEAAKTVLYGGMTETEALNMVTINPAKMLHLDNRIGSIKVGKEADVVLWNAHPLSIYARPDKTIIEGAIYFDIEKDQIMRDGMAKERNRLVQKMLEEKSAGASTQKPTFKKESHVCCDSITGAEGSCENQCGSYFGAKLMGH